jgi:hypothetical protein
MSQALYFQIILEPHHKHSGGKTGRKISFLAEVLVSVAKSGAKSPEDQQSVREEAQRLAADLTCMAMTGQTHQSGEDHMQISFRSIPRMSSHLTGRQPDAERNGVRVWLLGADPE